VLLTPRGLTVISLAAGAAASLVMAAAGVKFPFYPPPNLYILGAGALIAGLVRWRWAPAISAFTGVFIIIYFTFVSLTSGLGIGDLLGTAGAGVVGMVGTVVHLVGSAVGAGAGLVACILEVRPRREEAGRP
jgi:hypothetical protein